MVSFFFNRTKFDTEHNTINYVFVPPETKRIIPADRFDEWEYNSFSNGINNPPWTGQGERKKNKNEKKIGGPSLSIDAWVIFSKVRSNRILESVCCASSSNEI